MGVSCYVRAGVAVDELATVERMLAVGRDTVGDAVGDEGASVLCDLRGQEGLIVGFAQRLRSALTRPAAPT